MIKDSTVVVQILIRVDTKKLHFKKKIKDSTSQIHCLITQFPHTGQHPRNSPLLQMIS